MPFDFQRDGVRPQGGGGFVDHDLDRGDFLEGEAESGDRFRQSFQKPEGGAFHEGNHFFFDFAVIDRMVEGIGSAGMGKVAAQFQIEDESLFRSAFLLIKPDDRAEFQIPYEDFIHDISPG